MKCRASLLLVAVFSAGLVALAVLGGCAQEPASSSSGSGDAGSPTAAGPADLVLLGGKIVTMHDVQPEVQALAARGGRIVAMGSDAEVEGLIGAGTEVIELDGRLAIPGFIEGHAHFLGLGDAMMILDLKGARTWDDIVALVAEATRTAASGQWIRGRGWHQDKWERTPDPAIEGLPLHDTLSAASPDNPVILTHASGHATLANARAMELAGIDASTPDPPGGQILKDAQGRPTGFLRETAQGLVRQAEALSREATEGSKATRSVNRKRAELAAAECLRQGVTSFQDAGSSFEDVDLFKQLADEGKLPLRLWVMIRQPNDLLEKNLARYRLIDHADHHLTVRAIKISIDGALGSRGAWLLEPYTDAADLTGLNLVPVDEIEKTAALALEHDYQLCIHAIGDRANREVLNIYEQAFRATGAGDRRWRIEHAQHLHLDDIPRFAELGVIASMQAIHCTSDAPWVPDRLGDRRSEEGAYVWQKLMQSGAVVTNGTDAPVEDVSPIASFHAAVSRHLADGSVFYGEQRMSRLEALRAYTLNAAYAAFEEYSKGSLASGKLADIAVLSADILTIPEEEIPATEVLYTIVGGKVVYRK